MGYYYTVLLLLLTIFINSNLFSQIAITRLNNNQPIIDKSMASTGGNINGPMLVRIPDWVPPEQRPDLNARYYLYFASHWHAHIKMAWSVNIDGPYTIYNPGQGVFDLENYSKPANLTLEDHVASPDIHIDHTNKQFIMYFHVGTVKWDDAVIEGQKTVVATSSYGLDFNSGLRNVIICPFYARIFEFNNNLYALHKKGLSVARNTYDPWVHNETFSNSNPELWKIIANPLNAIPDEVRHQTLLKDGDSLHVMYSRYPSSPEHIEYSLIELKRSEKFWHISSPEDILSPEYEWEGVNFPLVESVSGIAQAGHELRDPQLFLDTDRQVYLLYTGGGEKAIGIARVDGLLSSDYFDFNCSDSLTLSPNPVAGDFLTISGLSNGAIIEVYSLSGKILIEEHVISSGSYQLDLHGIQNGLIMIMVRTGNRICWDKVILL